MKKLLISVLIIIPIIFDISCNNNSIDKLPLPLTELEGGWERIYIKDVGSFDIPPSMKVPIGVYKEFVDEEKKIKGFDETELIVQKKILIDSSNTVFANVILSTTISRPGEYKNLKFDISKYSQKDIAEINSAFQRDFQEGFNKEGLNIVEWYPLKVEKVNNMSCYHINYKYNKQDKRVFMVNMYQFYNYDRTHIFQLSYPISVEDSLKGDFEKILKSFRITNIK